MHGNGDWTAMRRAQGGVKWIHLKVETITSPLREQQQLRQMEQMATTGARRQAKEEFSLSQVQTNFEHPQVMKTIKYSWFNDHFAMLQLSVAAVPQSPTRNSHLSRNVNDGTDRRCCRWSPKNFWLQIKIAQWTSRRRENRKELNHKKKLSQMNVAHHEFSSSSSRSNEKALAPPSRFFSFRNRFSCFAFLHFANLPINKRSIKYAYQPQTSSSVWQYPPPVSSLLLLAPSQYIGHKVKMLINAVAAQISSGF